MNREKIINILPVVGISLIALALVSLITVLAVSMITEKQFLNAKNELVSRGNYFGFQLYYNYQEYDAELGKLADEAEKNIGNNDPKFWTHFEEKEKRLMEISSDWTVVGSKYNDFLDALQKTKTKNDLNECATMLTKTRELVEATGIKLAAYKEKYGK